MNTYDDLSRSDNGRPPGGGVRRRHRAPEGPAPGAEWPPWRAAGEQPDTADAEDEAIFQAAEFLVDAGVSPAELAAAVVANAARGGRPLYERIKTEVLD